MLVLILGLLDGAHGCISASWQTGIDSAEMLTTVQPTASRQGEGEDSHDPSASPSNIMSSSLINGRSESPPVAGPPCRGGPALRWRGRPESGSTRRTHFPCSCRKPHWSTQRKASRELLGASRSLQQEVRVLGMRQGSTRGGFCSSSIRVRRVLLCTTYMCDRRCAPCVKLSSLFVSLHTPALMRTSAAQLWHCSQ